MRILIDVKCNKNSRVTEEKLYGYILRAIAGVTANNEGIITELRTVMGKEGDE